MFLHPPWFLGGPLSNQIPGAWVWAWGRDTAAQCQGLGPTLDPQPPPCPPSRVLPFLSLPQKQGGQRAEEGAYQGPQDVQNLPFPFLCTVNDCVRPYLPGPRMPSLLGRPGSLHATPPSPPLFSASPPLLSWDFCPKGCQPGGCEVVCKMAPPASGYLRFICLKLQFY